MTFSIKVQHLVPLVLLGGMVGACQTSDTTPIGVSQLDKHPTAYTDGQPIGGAVASAVMVPGSNYSLVTVRERPLSGEIRTVLCQAPSPDWSTALAMQAQLQGSGNFFHGSTGSLNVSGSSTETIAAMAGRTAGVVALRDGLYSACQAYANGVIGKDTYALIVSQYGNLLVALAGANAASSDKSSSTSSSTTGSTPPGVAVAVNTAAAAPAGSPQQQQQQKSSDPSAGALGQAQLSIMQALLVACIGANDQSSVKPAYVNDLLRPGPNTSCSKIVDAVAASAVGLLKASAAAPGSGNPGGGGTKTADSALPDPELMKVQTAVGAKSDGFYGEETLGKIKGFQQANGLPPTGVADPATIDKLKSQGKI